jgi:hypothetical protein
VREATDERSLRAVAVLLAAAGAANGPATRGADHLRGRMTAGGKAAYVPPESRIRRSRRREYGWACEQVLQSALQGSLLEQAPPLVHLHEDVEVAPWSRVAAATEPNTRTVCAPR